MPLFNKLLVANRGEIACRIMRTAKRLGIRTVGVFSEPDARAPHVALADEAICVGGAASSSSYLRAEAIIAAVKATGACTATPRARPMCAHDAHSHHPSSAQVPRRSTLAMGSSRRMPSLPRL